MTLVFYFQYDTSGNIPNPGNGGEYDVQVNGVFWVNQEYYVFCSLASVGVTELYLTCWCLMEINFRQPQEAQPQEAQPQEAQPQVIIDFSFIMIFKDISNYRN